MRVEAHQTVTTFSRVPWNAPWYLRLGSEKCVDESVSRLWFAQKRSAGGHDDVR